MAKSKPGRPDEQSSIEQILHTSVTQPQEIDNNLLEYRSFISSLPVKTQELLLQSASDDSEIKLPEHRWCLCESPEGDYPYMYAYAKLRDLLKALATRVGTETSVWVFYGLPMPVAKLKRPEGQSEHYLLLPNKAAVKITPTGDTSFVYVDELGAEQPEPLQRGWMGDEAALESQYFSPGITEKTDSGNDFTSSSDDESGETLT